LGILSANAHTLAGVEIICGGKSSPENRRERKPVAGNKKGSGNGPAENLTVKQERLARRAEKVEAMRREQARVARNRRLLFIGGGVAVLAIVALVITFVVTGGSGSGSPAATQAAGLQTFPNLSRDHVQGKVGYPQVPPVGGPHNPVWLNCGVYDQPVPDENAVHDLEHGAVWVTYDADKVTGADLDTLRAALPSSYVTLSPYPGLPSPVVASAWGAQIQLDGPSDSRLADFLKTYWQSPSAPEPGAPCTGGLDAPGRVA
jgi:hypothetical protein